MKILMVDDCRITRKMLALYLKSSGYEVVSAENGMDAIEKLATQEVNLVMTDLNMPYMDGIELIKNLREDERFRHIPILMVTTEADTEERDRALAAGANGYLIKPVTAEKVAVNIRDILKDIFQKRGAL